MLQSIVSATILSLQTSTPIILKLVFDLFEITNEYPRTKMVEKSTYRTYSAS